MLLHCVHVCVYGAMCQSSTQSGKRFVCSIELFGKIKAPLVIVRTWFERWASLWWFGQASRFSHEFKIELWVGTWHYSGGWGCSDLDLYCCAALFVLWLDVSSSTWPSWGGRAEGWTKGQTLNRTSLGLGLGQLWKWLLSKSTACSNHSMDHYKICFKD